MSCLASNILQSGHLGPQNCLWGCPQGCCRRPLKALTAFTSIILRSIKQIDLDQTLAYRLILGMLFKIMHWMGSEGHQEKEMTANLPPATHPTELGTCNLSSPDEPCFPDWTKRMGLPWCHYCLPTAALSRLHSPYQKASGSQSQQWTGEEAHLDLLGYMYGIIQYPIFCGLTQYFVLSRESFVENFFSYKILQNFDHKS